MTERPSAELPCAEKDDHPACLAAINNELFDFAKNLGRIVALQKRKGFTYAFPSETVPSVPEEFAITERDVRDLPGFKSYASARETYARRRRSELREIVYVQNREGETDIVVGIAWK